MLSNPVRRAMVVCLALGVATTFVVAWIAAGLHRALASYGFMPPRPQNIARWVAAGPFPDRAVGWMMRERGVAFDLRVMGDDTQLKIEQRTSAAAPSIRLGAAPDPDAPSAVLMEMEAGWPLSAVRGTSAEPATPLRFGSIQMMGPGTGASAGATLGPTAGGGVMLTMGPPGTPQQTVITAPTIILSPTGLPAAPMPWKPMWPGFVVNTLAYALAWFVVWFLFFDLLGWRGRRKRRLARGQCLVCGYDLRGHVDRGRDAHATRCPECGAGRKV